MNQRRVVIRKDYVKGIGLGLLVLALVGLVGLGARAVVPLLASSTPETSVPATPAMVNPLAPLAATHTPPRALAATSTTARPAGPVAATVSAAGPRVGRGIALGVAAAQPGDLVEVQGWGWAGERLVKITLARPGEKTQRRYYGAAVPDDQGQFQARFLFPHDWAAEPVVDVVAFGSGTRQARATLQIGTAPTAPTPTAAAGQPPAATATPSSGPSSGSGGTAGGAAVKSSAQAGGAMRVGVRVNLLIAPGDRERTLRLARELGVQWLGQQVIWRDFEGVQGQRDWRFLDDAVGEASGQGFKLLLSVTKAPAWAQQGSRIDPVAYGDFVAALVSRYRGKVQAVEVYNEPNLAAEWGAACDAGAYAALLKEAYRRVKAVDPAVVVVSAGLTPTGVSDGHTAIEDTVFLAQVKQAGGLQYCDAVGAHVSGFNNPPNAALNSRCEQNPLYGCHASFYVLRYRELQRIAGSKPLWVTECGYAATNDPQPGYEYARDNPEALLGDYLAETLKLLRADGAGCVLWWNLNYAPLAPVSEQAGFSLVDRNWNPRIHFHRLKGEVGG